MSANSDVIKEPSSIPSNVTVFLLILTLLGLGGAIFINLSDQAEDGQYLAIGGDLRVNVQQVFSGARLAVEGDETAFKSLAKAQKDFSSSLSTLSKGNADLTSLRTWLPSEYKQLNTTWESVSTSVDTILANQDRILFLHEVAETLNESIPELQQEYNLVVDILVDGGARSDQAVLAQRQALLGERIARNIDKMLEGGVDAADAADQFNLDASLFGSVLEGMIDGNAAMRIDKVVDEEALESLTQIDELYAFVNNSVDKIFQASPDLLNTRQSVDLILGSAEELNTQLDTLIAQVDTIADQRLMKQIYIYFIAVLAVVLIIILALLASVNARRRLELEEQTNEASQRAILTLLDELADLADGDLRTKATVTEEFTGAIADSINFTIDQLRVLVSRITESSMSISGASQTAKNTSEELSSAADKQASEIAEATLSINEMADTIGQVSNEAADSATVATRSVEIAKNGALVVRNTIGGMDTIREQIQDTSKRIKRLGESSQEIGDIVSLINDIADQTNILSLNAAIQASMAGDAGRGFAVVADEVQRLAERSSAATKQIEALVKAIQTDTNEAVISMEQTTTEVVRGARLAQDAGVALEEIETVSTDIAKLIQSISVSAGSQAQKATQVSERMNIIQDITTQTSSGTKATADSIGNLTSLSIDMRNSVAGFTLPADVLDDTDESEVFTDDAELALEEDGDSDAILEGDGHPEQGDPVALEEDLFDEDDALEGFVAEETETSVDATVQIDALQTVQMVAGVESMAEEEAVDADVFDESFEDMAGLDDTFDVDDESVFEALLDEGDTPTLDTDQIVSETLGAADEAVADMSDEEPLEADDEEDEFMLGLDDDFDLDLDDFSFDDDSDQKA